MLHFILQIDRTRGERLHTNSLSPLRHDLDRLGRSAYRIADAIALDLPPDGDPFSRRERNVAFGPSERAGHQLQVERVRPSVEPCMERGNQLWYNDNVFIIIRYIDKFSKFTCRLNPVSSITYYFSRTSNGYCRDAAGRL